MISLNPVSIPFLAFWESQTNDFFFTPDDNENLIVELKITSKFMILLCDQNRISFIFWNNSKNTPIYTLGVK
jgi:hypothetical protein